MAFNPQVQMTPVTAALTATEYTGGFSRSLTPTTPQGSASSFLQNNRTLLLVGGGLAAAFVLWRFMRKR